MLFSPKALKPGYGPDSAKIVSAIKVLKTIRPLFWMLFGPEM